MPLKSCAVVVPSFRRPSSLARCLQGLAAQTRKPDDIVVVVRQGDTQTALLVKEQAASGQAVRLAVVGTPGLVQALNCGLAAVWADVVAFTDDDAVPRADWLERIMTIYSLDPNIAAVGGRDLVHMDGQTLDGPSPGLRAQLRFGRKAPIGKLYPSGRLSGDHHLGRGMARDVDVLKGVNMSYRRELLAEIGFDERLAGNGSQVNNEQSACLPLRRRGFRVVYDPRVLVDHYVGGRSSGDERSRVDFEAVRNGTFNHALVVFDHLSVPRRVAFIGWNFAFGTGGSPGLLNLARLVLQHQQSAPERFVAAQRGVWDAWHAKRTTIRPPLETHSVASAQRPPVRRNGT